MHAPTSLLLRGTLVAASLLAGSAVLSAQNVTVATDPYGALVIPLKGGSDTHISLPVHRPTALEAKVASITGNVITLQAPVSLTGNQFVYASGTQPNTYYVQFATGDKEGEFYTVTANAADSLTVNLNGDTLEGVVTANTTLFVIPYWTLNTLFPDGNGIHPSPTLVQQSIVALPNHSTPGINLSAAELYYYYTGTAFGGAGWRKSGAPLTSKFPDAILFPDSPFFVRNAAGTTDTELVLTGAVPMSGQAIIVNNLASDTAQDNAVALPVPVDVTLAQSGLFPNIIAGSPTLVAVDSLFVYDPAVTAINKSATAIYFYYSGAAFGGPGWRKSGDALTNKHDNAQVFKPGWGFVIRRGARPTPESVVWTYVPAYLE